MNPTLLLMEITTLLLVLSLTRNYFSLDLLGSIVVARFLSAKAGLQSVGGIWFGLIGAPLAAWFLTTFFILPLMGITNYSLNIQTVLSFANPTAVLIFLALWAGIAFGFLGATAYRRGSKGK